jgi:hypothetical protein
MFTTKGRTLPMKDSAHNLCRTFKKLVNENLLAEDV